MSVKKVCRASKELISHSFLRSRSKIVRPTTADGRSTVAAFIWSRVRMKVVFSLGETRCLITKERTGTIDWFGKRDSA